MLGASILIARQRGVCGKVMAKAAGVVFGASILTARQRGVCGEVGIESHGGELCREFRLAEDVLWVVFC